MKIAAGILTALLTAQLCAADEVSDAKAFAEVGRAAYDQHRYDDAIEAHVAAYRRYPAADSVILRPDTTNSWTSGTITLKSWTTPRPSLGQPRSVA